MTIHIHSLEFDAIIGILEHERTSPQKVMVDIDIKYEQKNEKDFIDYAQVIADVEKQIRTKRYELLEDAIKELKKDIKKRYDNIKKLKICISKPDIFSNCRISVSKKWKF